MSWLKKLEELGADANDLPTPGGAYAAVNIRNTNGTVAIQLPIVKGQFLFQGVLGRDLTSQQGAEAARLSALNVAKQLTRYVKESDFVGLNHVDIIYQCTTEWEEGPLVADGASLLFNEFFGEKGTHTRSISGVKKLPRNFCVALVVSFTVRQPQQ